MTPAARDLLEAPSLDALLERLRRLPATGVTLDVERALARLPVFGGAPPVATDGTWSWDPTRLLVGTCSADFRLVPRPTCEAEGCDRLTGVAGSAGGLCPTHYRQMRRRGRTQPILQPADHRLGVRLAADAYDRLASEGAPATVARRVIETWARGR